MVLRKLSSETHNCYVNYWWWKYYVIVLQFIPVSIGSYIVGKCYRVFVKMQHNLPYICTWMLLLWNVIFVWKCTGWRCICFSHTLLTLARTILYSKGLKSLDWKIYKKRLRISIISWVESFCLQFYQFYLDFKFYIL